MMSVTGSKGQVQEALLELVTSGSSKRDVAARYPSAGIGEISNARKEAEVNHGPHEPQALKHID